MRKMARKSLESNMAASFTESSAAGVPTNPISAQQAPKELQKET
jgi:hypothetical protein